MWNFIWSRRKPASHIQFCFLLIGERYSANRGLTWVVMFLDKAFHGTQLCLSHSVSTTPGWGTMVYLLWRLLNPVLMFLLLTPNNDYSVLGWDCSWSCLHVGLWGEKNLVPAYSTPSYRLASLFKRHSFPNQLDLSLKMNQEASHPNYSTFSLWDTRNVPSIVWNCSLIVSK